MFTNAACFSIMGPCVVAFGSMLSTATCHPGMGGGISGAARGGGSAWLSKDSMLLAKRASIQHASLVADPSSSSQDGQSQARALLQQVEKAAIGMLSVARGGGWSNGTLDVMADLPSEEALQLILNMLDDNMLSDMQTGHQADLHILDLGVQAAKNCSASLDAKAPALCQIDVELRDLESRHKVCREQLDASKRAGDNICEEAYDFQATHLSGFACRLKDSRLHDHLFEHLQCVTDFAGALSEATRLAQSCKNNSLSVEAKEVECDATGSAHNETLSRREQHAMSACESYEDCHVQAEHSFRALQAQVRFSEGGRKDQAVAVARIKCFVDSVLKADVAELGVNGTGDARIAACHALSGLNASSDFIIRYPELPKATECPYADARAPDTDACMQTDIGNQAPAACAISSWDDLADVQLAASSEYRGDWGVNNIKKVDSLPWWPGSSSFPQWITFTFQKPVALKGLRTKTHKNYPRKAFKDFRFEYSSDEGAAWTIFHEGQGPNAVCCDWGELEFGTPTPPSRKFRLWMDSTHETHGTILVAIEQLQLEVCSDA